MIEMFSIKRALTRGIEKLEGSVSESNFEIFRPLLHSNRPLRLGTDCFLTREEAVAQLHVVLDKRIASFTKSIRNAENLKRRLG